MATRIPRNAASFTLVELLAATGGALVARGASERATTVWTNTRDMDPGAGFVALRGQVHDGHAYLGAAAARGAAIAVVEREVDVPPGLTVVRVESTLRALADLASVHVRRWHALGGRTLVGITGSAGKTTTRVATAALVESLYPGELCATRGNLNNRIGVPMMLFSLDASRRVAVLELGTSEPGEIAELGRMARPDVGVLTLVAAAHLDGLGSLDGVEAEKSALLRALPHDGIAVGNGDDARVLRAVGAAACARHVTYGRRDAADVRVAERTPIGMTGSRVVLAHAGGRRVAFETSLVGEAGALACAAAVATVEAAFRVRLEDDLLTDALRNVDVAEGAQRLVPLSLASGLAVLDDTYNANPASMASSIRAAAEIAAAMGRTLVLVLGEMRELGSEAARGHDEVGRVAAESGARIVVAVGGGEAHRVAERAREGGAAVLVATSVDDGIAAVADAVRPSDLVLVKASRSVGTDRIVAELARRHGDAR
jgi:UDP-N-acetylmuramoyl-tripeptide--D-alanyl-D-alanine ligase